jgi:guanosine-3',5'-bis(diphosphate) 3'-pyrophosphohydrolase
MNPEIIAALIVLLVILASVLLAWRTARQELKRAKRQISAAGAAQLLRALAFAAQKHRDQRRKDVEASPYINHPIAVAAVLSAEAGVSDEETLVAAILHDTIEDTQTTFEELEQQFGLGVARLVAEMTDNKSLPKAVRKQQQIEHAAAASDKAKRLKIADKICNVRDVATRPPTDWGTQRRREYLDWAAQVVHGCRGVEPALEMLFDEALAEGQKRVADDA